MLKHIKNLLEKRREAKRINKQFEYLSAPIPDNTLTSDELISMKEAFKNNPGALNLLEYYIEQFHEQPEAK